ncbi:MAG: class I SAM-dependent methyltransferase [Gammaproteobacteria bacterium]
MEPNLEQKQAAVQQFWNGKPCDSENSQLSPTDKGFFEQIEADRYKHQSHILTVLDKIDWQGRKVLEIGTGVGTDARQLISRGAEYFGINVDEGSCQMTRQALDVFGLPGTLQAMSATATQFPDSTFDVVYSFGVLHHIPDVNKAILDIHRILKPGGKLLFMVYNRSSINYQIEIRYLRRWALKLLLLPGVINFFVLFGFPKDKLIRHVELFRDLGKMSDAEWLSRNTDGPDSPYSLVYGEEEAEALLSGRFHILSNEVLYFEPRHWGPVGRLLPKSLVRFLGKRWGWHRVVLAERI